jgi:hypothetical protein
MASAIDQIIDVMAMVPERPDGVALVRLMQTCKGLRERGARDVGRLKGGLRAAVDRLGRFLGEVTDLKVEIDRIDRKILDIMDRLGGGILTNHDPSSRMMHALVFCKYIHGPLWHVAASPFSFPTFVQETNRQLYRDFDFWFLDGLLDFAQSPLRPITIAELAAFGSLRCAVELARVIDHELVPFYQRTWRPWVDTVTDSYLQPIESILMDTFNVQDGLGLGIDCPFAGFVHVEDSTEELVCAIDRKVSRVFRSPRALSVMFLQDSPTGLKPLKPWDS